MALSRLLVAFCVRDFFDYGKLLAGVVTLSFSSIKLRFSDCTARTRSPHD